jgi:outer membrane protein insertion porin family
VGSLDYYVQRNSKSRGLKLVLLASFLCSGSTLGAEEKTPQLYEGLKVSSIEVIARPTVNIQRLRPLVRQGVGKPYSATAVQESAAALRTAANVSKVDVEVKPEAEGLRVTFILEPAFYVGMIYFRGAAKQFSYQRLLQVVNYPAQEPYDKARANKGIDSLTRFFAQQGYFAAHVAMESRLDEPRTLADIVYDVALGRRAKLGTIEITGPPPAEVAKLKSALHSLRARLRGVNLSEGKPFDPERLQTATRFLQAFLGRQNYFANTVRLEAPEYDPKSCKAALHWRVRLGPEVLVHVTGARISRRVLRTFVPIFEENSFDQDLVQEGQRNLVSYFQGKGYFDAKVTPQTSQSPAQISLVYTVELGERHRVATVRIAGNRHFDEGFLDDQLAVQKAQFFLLSHGKFSNDLLNRSVTNLTNFYRSAGYSEVQVQPQISDHEGRVEITFRIREGELTRVAKLDVQGNRTQSLGRLVPKGLNLKPGQPYSQSRLDKDRSRIIASYLELGYPNATLRWSVKPAADVPHQVVVTFLIEEGAQVQVSGVEFLGQDRTNLALLQRNTSVKAHAPLNEAKLLGTESSLYNLGIFDWVDVAPERPITNERSEEVLVKVHEAKRNSVSYGFGLIYTPVAGSVSSGIVALPGLPTLGIPSSFRILEKTVFSPLGSVEYSRLNLFGRAETASVATSLSVLDQRGSLSYADPQFRSLNWAALATISAERSAQNPLFTARLGTGSFQLERTLDAAKTKRLQFRYTFQRTTLTNLHIKDFIPSEDQNVRSSMVSASFIRDTRDKPLDAHRGFFQTLDFGVSPKMFGSTDNFARFFGQSAYYRQMEPWMVWANNVRVGLVDSFAGSHVPISEEYFSGGADSLRGFPLNGAGPQIPAELCTEANNSSTCTARITAPAGGHQLFIVNSEGRFPIPISFPSPINKNLGAAIFYDGGNVYSSIGFRHFFSGYTSTVGIGLRYQTPVGPVRVDIGQNLNPVPGFKSTQLFITLGQSF